MSTHANQKLLADRLRTTAERSGLTYVEIVGIFEFLTEEWRARQARAEADAFIAKSDAKGRS
jgi:hypothetical protein